MDNKRRRADSREGLKVTTVALPAETLRRLSIIAIEENTVMTELVRQAVAEWLKRHTASRRGGR